jgi:hypothetical protein
MEKLIFYNTFIAFDDKKERNAYIRQYSNTLSIEFTPYENISSFYVGDKKVKSKYMEKYKYWELNISYFPDGYYIITADLNDGTKVNFGNFKIEIPVRGGECCSSK